MEDAHAVGADTPRSNFFSDLYRSRLESEAGNHDAAQAHARAAIQHAGDMPSLAVPARAVLAQALLQAGRPAEAVPIACEALAALESMPGVDDFEGLIPLTAAEALWANGQQAEAKRVLTIGRDRLLARAALISDPAVRTRFLALRDHAQTLQRARVWLDG
jgi:hypothetical protein